MHQFVNRYGILGAVMPAVLASVAIGGTLDTTAFTYQGQLKQNGVPVTDTCDFEFGLWTGDNDPDPGIQIASTIQVTAEVRNGLFQVELDFGATAFDGDARWLQIDVCCTSPCSPAFIPLTPRQPLSAAPYAIHTRGIDVDDMGNVGVGTKDPSQKLDVRGLLQIQNSIRLDEADAPMIVRQWDPMTTGRHTGFGRWGMFMEFENLFFGIPGSDFPFASSLRFGGWQADSTREDWMTIDKSGNVGIGTTQPTKTLDILNGAGTSLRIGLDANQSLEIARYGGGLADIPGSNFGMQMIGPLSSHLVVDLRANDGDDGLYVRVPSVLQPTPGEPDTTAFAVKASGKVGIGTPTPVNKLDVEGGVAIGATYAGVDAAPSDGLIVQGKVGIGTTAINALSTLQVTRTTAGCAIFGANVQGGPIVRGPLLAATGVCASATSEFANVYGLRAVAESSSQWTIGVNAIAAGTGDTNIAVEGRAFGATTNWGGFFVGDGYFSGKVGIGTNTPGAQLDVAGQIRSSGATGGRVTATNPNNQLAEVSLSWLDDVARIRVGGNGVGGQNGLDIQTTSNTSLMRLLHNGNVGIGTRFPSARLEVWSSSTTPAIFNRLGNDGTLVSLKQDHSGVGSISVSGNTVSYNSFTGSHLGWSDEQPARGMLMTMTGENHNLHGDLNAETIYGMTTSSSANDSKCLGAHLGLLEPTRPMSLKNPRLVMAVGNGDMWVVNTGRNLKPGDYLISSDVRGHAMLDDPEQFPTGYVVARVGETVNWSNVTEAIDGRKHKKISVFFENFSRASAVTAGNQFKIHQEQIAALRAEVSTLKESIRKITHPQQASTPGMSTPITAAIFLVGMLAMGWSWRNPTSKELSHGQAARTTYQGNDDGRK